MAKYTAELRTLIVNGYDIGLSDYPIYDESYRDILNQKIIDHYYFCEIGAETPGRFKLFINRTMREIMPYYNQLYASAALEINPLHNFDLTEQTKREMEGSNTGTVQSTGSSEVEQEGSNLDVNSDTPANLLSVSDIKNNVYASQASRAASEGRSSNSNQDSSTSASEGSSLEEYIRTLSGSQGLNQSEALTQYRKTFINIDMQIIDDLATCFMGLW